MSGPRNKRAGVWRMPFCLFASRGYDMVPEQRLWQAVLYTAIRDATASNPSLDTDIREKSRADSWIRGGGRDSRMVCEMVGVDPDFIQDSYVSGRINPALLRGLPDRWTRAK